MPFLVALLVIALIIAFLFLSTLFIVPQQQAYIIERFGKFKRETVPVSTIGMNQVKVQQMLDRAGFK